jgi:hypothetical protein
LTRVGDTGFVDGYRWLIVGAGASLLGIGMFLLDWLAGPVLILDMGSGGQISSDQGEYAMVAIALMVVGATTAVASLIASRDDPDRPRWVRGVAVVLIVFAVVAVALAILAIAFILILCADGCN